MIFIVCSNKLIRVVDCRYLFKVYMVFIVYLNKSIKIR